MTLLPSNTISTSNSDDQTLSKDGASLLQREIVNVHFENSHLSAERTIDDEFSQEGIHGPSRLHTSQKISLKEAIRLNQPRSRIARRGKNQFKTIYKWECVVESIEEEVFTARLYDLEKGGTVEEGEFLIEDISEADLPLLKPGAFFYLILRYETIQGQRRKVSMLRFKRSPILDGDDLDEVFDQSNSYKEALTWE